MEIPQMAHSNLNGTPHLLSTTPLQQCYEAPQCLDMGVDTETLEAMHHLSNEFDVSHNFETQQMASHDFEAQQMASRDFEAQQFWLESMQQPQVWDASMETMQVDQLQAVQEELSMGFATSDLSVTWTLEQSQEMDFGSLQYPTVGSQAHQFGTCTPCAFVYTKGCSNGVLCPFCHLCDVGERKRRAKDKRTARKGPIMQW